MRKSLDDMQKHGSCSTVIARYACDFFLGVFCTGVIFFYAFLLLAGVSGVQAFPHFNYAACIADSLTPNQTNSVYLQSTIHNSTCGNVYFYAPSGIPFFSQTFTQMMNVWGFAESGGNSSCYNERAYTIYHSVSSSCNVSSTSNTPVATGPGFSSITCADSSMSSYFPDLTSTGGFIVDNTTEDYTVSSYNGACMINMTACYNVPVFSPDNIGNILVSWVGNPFLSQRCMACPTFVARCPDCEGVPGGNATVGCDGVCNSNITYDCAGVCNGTAVFDDCGVCNGNNTEKDCAGVCNGTAYIDPTGRACIGTSTILANCSGDSYVPSGETYAQLRSTIVSASCARFEYFDINSHVTTAIAFVAMQQLAGYAFPGNDSTCGGADWDNTTYHVNASCDQTVTPITSPNVTTWSLASYCSDSGYDAPLDITTTPFSIVEFDYSPGIPDNLTQTACLLNYTICYSSPRYIAGEWGNVTLSMITGDAQGYCTSCLAFTSRCPDCLGVPGGSATLDCEGVCNGTAVIGCNGVCNSNLTYDCAGVCNGTAVFDDCGVCNGNNTEKDCAGVCNGTAVIDCTGICNGNATLTPSGQSCLAGDKLYTNCTGGSSDPTTPGTVITTLLNATCVRVEFLTYTQTTTTLQSRIATLLPYNTSTNCTIEFSNSEFVFNGSCPFGPLTANSVGNETYSLNPSTYCQYSGASYPFPSGVLDGPRVDSLVNFSSGTVDPPPDACLPNFTVCFTDTVFSTQIIGEMLFSISPFILDQGRCMNCETFSPACVDCFGNPNGTAHYDCAGVCNGTAVYGCDGICNSNLTYDCFGVCGGNATLYGNSTCIDGNVMQSNCSANVVRLRSEILSSYCAIYTYFDVTQGSVFAAPTQFRHLMGYALPGGNTTCANSGINATFTYNLTACANVDTVDYVFNQSTFLSTDYCTDGTFTFPADVSNPPFAFGTENFNPALGSVWPEGCLPNFTVCYSLPVFNSDNWGPVVASQTDMPSKFCQVCDAFQTRCADCAGIPGGNTTIDCAGVCNGTAVYDDCGVCNGNNTEKDCAGVCFGNSTYDDCGVCGGMNMEKDCAGVCNGSAVFGCDGVCNSNVTLDCAGVCNGTAVRDCAGICNGTTARDCAGVCNGTTHYDCFLVCGGNATFDVCNVCGGDNSSLGCDGTCFSGQRIDDCGICNGLNLTKDCAGVCNGTAVYDCTGVCNGNNTCIFCPDNTTKDCLGICNGTAEIDICGLCNGQNNTLGCDGNCTAAQYDNCGVCNGFDQSIDCAGVCGGNATFDCYGVCNGTTVVDSCGVCNGNDTARDCNGTCFGNLVIDDCGVCGGLNNEKDCLGVCNGTAVLDSCGVCNGNNTAIGCDGDCFSAKTYDGCGVCGGYNNSKDCFGVCGGNATYDCNYVCGGNATIDACGQCNGYNRSKDCFGNCFGNATLDCSGVCGGSNGTTECGVCTLNGSAVGCDSVCFSGKTYDLCGVCGGNNADVDCNRTCFGGLVVNECGLCGTNLTGKGCDGVCNSGKYYDDCGVCGGQNSEKGCDGVCFSNTTVDACGVCGGKNACFTNDSLGVLAIWFAGLSLVAWIAWAGVNAARSTSSGRTNLVVGARSLFMRSRNQTGTGEGNAQTTPGVADQYHEPTSRERSDDIPIDSSNVSSAYAPTTASGFRMVQRVYGELPDSGPDESMTHEDSSFTTDGIAAYSSEALRFRQRTYDPNSQ